MRLLGRPARALMPLALIGAALLGDMNRVLAIFAVYVMTNLFSLCAGAALRFASGGIVDDRRMRGNFAVALVLQAAGLVLAYFFARRHMPNADIHVCATGALLCASQLFSDRLCTVSDALSAPLSDFITAAFLFAGLLFSRGDSMVRLFGLESGENAILACAALVGCAVAACVCAGVCRVRKPRAGFALIKKIPYALVKAFAFPMLALLAIKSAPGRTLSLTCLAAYALYSWLLPERRRGEGESFATDIFVPVISAAFVLVTAFFPWESPQTMQNARLAFALGCAGALLAGSALGVKTCVSLLAMVCAAAVIYDASSPVFAAVFANPTFPGVKAEQISRAVAAVLCAVSIILPATSLPLLIRRMRGRARARG